MVVTVALVPVLAGTVLPGSVLREMPQDANRRADATNKPMRIGEGYENL
jgi:hypothetical protein